MKPSFWPVVLVAYAFVSVVFQNLFSSWLETNLPNQLQGIYGWGSLAVMMVALYVLLLRRSETIGVSFQKARTVPDSEALPYKGLVAVVPPLSIDPKNRDLQLQALINVPEEMFSGRCTLEPIAQAVMRCPQLQHLWMITTREKRPNEEINTSEEAAVLAHHFVLKYPNLKVHFNRPDLVIHHNLNADLLNRSYEVVTELFEHHLEGLYPSEVACDVTSGLKPLSVGMVLASLGPDRDILYHGFKAEGTFKPAQFKFKTEKKS